MLITSKDNSKIKDYIKLKQKKYRDETNTFIVEGLHSVIEAFRSGLLIEAILEQDEVIPIECEKVYVTRELIELISSTEHPENVMGLCNKRESTLEGDKILLIDGVQDPGNLGTIIRSSLAFNVDTIVLGKGTTDLYNPKTVRSTQGMLFHINIVNGDLDKVIDELKERDIPIYGTNVSYGIDVKELSSKDTERYALIVGNEGAGVNRDLLDKCDKLLCIKMNDLVESLNVGVATSILLYELRGK